MLLDCKKQFYHHYILEDIKQEDNPFSQMGNAIHTALEVWRENPKMFRKQLIGVYANEFKPDKEFDWLFRQGCKILHTIDQKKVFIGELVAVEQEFYETIHGVTIKGLIDKIEKVDDELVITDYKTNKAVEPELYHHQLGIYDIAMEHMFPNTKRRYELFYVRYNKIVEFRFTEDFHKKMLDTTNNVVDYIVENQDKPEQWGKLPKKDKPCSFCALKDKCW